MTRKNWLCLSFKFLSELLFWQILQAEFTYVTQSEISSPVFVERVLKILLLQTLLRLWGYGWVPGDWPRRAKKSFECLQKPIWVYKIPSLFLPRFVSPSLSVKEMDKGEFHRQNRVFLQSSHLSIFVCQEVCFSLRRLATNVSYDFVND